MSSPGDYLFVYGSLRRPFGHPMHQRLVLASEFVGEGFFFGRLYDLGAYPAAVLSDDPGDRVVGEVYRLSPGARDATLRMLDAYEGYVPDDAVSSLYRRERHQVILCSGETLEAWIYVYNRSLKTLQPIGSGDYARYRLAQ